MLGRFGFAAPVCGQVATHGLGSGLGVAIDALAKFDSATL
jgi:hypothetical protein